MPARTKISTRVSSKPWVEQTQSNFAKGRLIELIGDGSKTWNCSFIENQTCSSVKEQKGIYKG